MQARRVQSDSDGWVRCPLCRHKLFKISGGVNGRVTIDIKCHSCRGISILIIEADK